MDLVSSGMIGGIVGAVFGVAGGGFGTWCSIRKAPPGPQRRFVVRCAVYMWLGVTAFLALLFLLPFPYGLLMWIPYPFLLIWSIRHFNAGWERVREEQAPSQSIN